MRPDSNDKNFNPFPGLRPFTPEENNLFFGRDKESDEVLEKLLKNRFISVIGAPGSGKTSLINCGVLQKLKDQGILHSHKWRFVTFRPEDDPFGNFADAIIKNIPVTEKRNTDRENIISGLLDNPDGISVSLRNLSQGTDDNLLMVIDQFEDLFRYGSYGNDQHYLEQNEKFIDSLVSSISQSGANIYAIVVLRSDYVSECAHYHGLTQLINNSNYLVPQMAAEQYREAIVGPIEYAGAQIEPKLIDQIISDIGDRANQLPVLQHVLMRTWTHWLDLEQPERPLNTNDYAFVGAMSKAVSIHADEAYEELSLRQREICEKMFKAITEEGSDNKAHRHPASVKKIKRIVGCTGEELFEVIEKFRIPSRSFITPPQEISLNDESVIDLSGESLILLWGRLREWINDEVASVQIYMRLSEASAMYQQGKTSLYKQPDLQQAINWRNQYKPTLGWAEQYNPAYERAMVYLRTSEKEYLEKEGIKSELRKGRIERTRKISIILVFAVIASVVFMIFSYTGKVAADKEASQAERHKTEAEIQKAKSDSTARSVKEQLGEAINNASIAEQDAEVIRVEREISEKKKQIALSEVALAQKNVNLAREKADSATRLNEITVRKLQIANSEKDEAMRLRMLSVGKIMSIKSLQMNGQKNLQTLLAYQAYLFNKKYNGPDNEADIFAGLYNVVRQYGSSEYKSFKGHNGEIKSIAFVPGKNEFYTSGSDGKVLRWSLDGRNQTFQVVYSGSDIIDVLAISPDASWLACGGEDASIKMIPLKPDNSGYELRGHKGKVKSLIFSFDGKYLYSAALDGNVLKWDIAAHTSINVSDGSMHITSIDISSNGNFLAGISTDGKVVVWDPDRKSDNFRIETAGKDIKVIRFNPDNNLLALGDAGGNIELWDISQRKKISEVKAHNGQINDIRFNPGLKQMASAGNDMTFKLFNIKDPSDLTEAPVKFTDNEGLVLVLQFSPDSREILAGTDNGIQNLVSRPTNVDYLVKDICNLVSGNMTQNEWSSYVGKDIPFENTCPGKNFNIKIEPIK